MSNSRKIQNRYIKQAIAETTKLKEQIAQEFIKELEEEARNKRIQDMHRQFALATQATHSTEKNLESDTCIEMKIFKRS